MECKACGYIREKDYSNDENSIGTEEFIYLKTAVIEISGETKFDNDRKVHLYACPECGTVQMNRWR